MQPCAHIACSNELEELGEWVGKLSRLSKLDLSCNQLTTVPTTVLQLPSLTFFNLRKNRIRELPRTVWNERFGFMMRHVQPASALATIDLRDNELQCLPDLVLTDALQELKTAGNPWPAAEAAPQALSVGLPSLMDLALESAIGSLSDSNISLALAQSTIAVQLHFARNCRACSQCQRRFTHTGHDCVYWRPTSDQPQVPFHTNVCSRACFECIRRVSFGAEPVALDVANQ